MFGLKSKSEVLEVKESVEKLKEKLENILVDSASHELNEAVRNLKYASAYLAKECDKAEKE